MSLYQTPFGTFSTWEEAAAAVEKRDMDPCTCIEIVRPAFVDVSAVTEYGMTQKLSNAVRVY